MRAFDIRFSKSDGLRGLFEAPANGFGWKGAGRLSIGAEGIRIAVRRSLLTLLSGSSRVFPPDSLTEAYREGDELRLVFADGSQGQTLAVWAGRGAASEIVKLLPTRQTVELDHATIAARRFRVDWRAVATALMVATIVTVAAVFALRDVVPGASPGAPAATDAPALPRAGESSTPAISEAAQVENTITPGPADRLTRGQQSTASRHASHEPAVNAATTGDALREPTDESASLAERDSYVPPRHFRAYEVEVSTLRTDYYDWDGRIPPDALRALEQRWWELTVDIYNRSRMGVDYGGSQEARVLAVSRAWRNHLSIYAEVLETGNQSLMPAAQAELAFAEALGRNLLP